MSVPAVQGAAYCIFVERCAAQVPLTIGSFFILLRAAFCISANLTTNESIVNVRYAYLRGPDEKFWNYFDRGVLPNCIQFWLSEGSRPDWGLIYQRESQVHGFYNGFHFMIGTCCCISSRFAVFLWFS
jgi:hypothetical protein